MTGTLALGLVLLRLYGGGITPMVEGFLYGNLLFIDDQSLDFIVTIGLVALFAGSDVQGLSLQPWTRWQLGFKAYP